jgi:cytosine/adenosine deaminase-related metal-dependent hydrolase
VASYNPWIGISWLVTGKTVGGARVHPASSTLDRETAVRLYTEGSAWFSTESGKKGALVPGQYADLAVLDRDLMSVAEDSIKDTVSLLTIVGGRVVWADGAFREHAPPALPAAPSWSPVAAFGGYQGVRAPKPQAAERASADRLAQASCGCGTSCGVHGHAHAAAWGSNAPASDLRSFWGALGCACFL